MRMDRVTFGAVCIKGSEFGNPTPLFKILRQVKSQNPTFENYVISDVSKQKGVVTRMLEKLGINNEVDNSSDKPFAEALDTSLKKLGFEITA